MDPNEVLSLLTKPGAWISAFDPTGSRTVAVPDRFRVPGCVMLETGSPLDPIAPDSHAAAVAAFVQARATGSGTARIVTSEGEHRHLSIVDLTSAAGCFIAVVAAADDEGDTLAGHDPLPARTCWYHLDSVGAIEAVSPDFGRMFGYCDDEVVGRSSLELIHPDDHDAGIHAWMELLQTPGSQERIRQRFRTGDGRWMWCEVTDTNHLNEPDRGHVIGEILDISAEMAIHAALERRERLLDRLSRALPTAVLHVESSGQVTVSNQRWTMLTGLDPDEGLDALVDRLADPDALRAAVAGARTGATDHDLPIRLTEGPGTCRFGELHLRPLANDDGTIDLLVTLDDVTHLHEHRLELVEQARRDPLTEALNRRGIERYLDERLTARRPADPGFAVLFLDLDRFKSVNDRHGHDIGDRVLRLVAHQIRRSIRPTDRLGRLGGDEFLVVLDQEADEDPAIDIAARIEAAIGRAAVAAELDFGVSIGIAFADDDDDVTSLVQRADHAMYTHKARVVPSTSNGGTEVGAGWRLDEHCRDTRTGGHEGEHPDDLG